MAEDHGNLPSKPGGEARKADVDAFLRKVAATPVTTRPGGRGRLIFAMDATASREPTWDRACHIQGEMFRETAALGGLEIQLVFYRGFGECKASGWLTRSDELLRRMTGVFCLGGRTQIEKVLKRAVTETKDKRVNALVFVGDAMEEDVGQRRAAQDLKLGSDTVAVKLRRRGAHGHSIWTILPADQCGAALQFAGLAPLPRFGSIASRRSSDRKGAYPQGSHGHQSTDVWCDRRGPCTWLWPSGRSAIHHLLCEAALACFP